MLTVTIKDEHGHETEVKVSESVYLFLQASDREEYNQAQQDKRHIDKHELTDQLIAAHGFRQAPDVTEQYIAREAVAKIFAVLQTCTPTQKRRFLLHNVYGMPYVEISMLENCSEYAIRKSVSQVKKIIENIF